MSIKTCIICCIDIVRIKKPTAACNYYIDETGSHWKGKVCPSCEKTRRRARYGPNGMLKWLYCINCNTRFRQRSLSQISCYSGCDDSIKYPIIKQCVTCHKSFEVGKHNLYKVACKHSHTPGMKKAQKIRKRLKMSGGRLPKWADKNQLYEIYKNCPKGHTVDHIIPLAGKIVCGLHVPENLQYLTKNENSFKNSKFDGTLENDSWKSEYQRQYNKNKKLKVESV